ncbi:hypothetical protein WQ54_23255 [Bacillus sp. SA1-12]|uniref:sensor histidine kinase n=1 Tax=Bacillus sp. SA1-12 TaxID=1455638 RepID=UPI000626F219|nr:hypothetical protein WQ54_23255 [Bacillus sp. SA1-12]
MYVNETSQCTGRNHHLQNQEALTNIRKYASVDKALVKIKIIADIVYVEIQDKGSGFDIIKESRGVGLFSMEERAKSVEGSFLIESSQDKGTKVTVEIPVFN